MKQTTANVYRFSIIKLLNRYTYFYELNTCWLFIILFKNKFAWHIVLRYFTFISSFDIAVFDVIGWQILPYKWIKIFLLKLFIGTDRNFTYRFVIYCFRFWFHSSRIFAVEMVKKLVKIEMKYYVGKQMINWALIETCTWS